MPSRMPPDPPRALPIVHHPAYDARFDPAHRFPMGKFGLVARVLTEDGLAPDGFHVPGAATAPWIARVHDRAYVDRVLSASVTPAEARRIGFETVFLRPVMPSASDTTLNVDFVLRPA